jgi:hypothetical protein
MKCISLLVNVILENLSKSEFWCINLRPSHRWEISIKWNFKKWDKGAWTGLIWFRIGTGGWHLQACKWTFKFHKMQGISWELLAFQEGLHSMESVSQSVGRYEFTCTYHHIVKLLFCNFTLHVITKNRMLLK